MIDPGIVLGLSLPFCGMEIIALPPLTLLSGNEDSEDDVGHLSFPVQATRSLYFPVPSRVVV